MEDIDMRRLFIFEISGYHHDCLQSLIELAIKSIELGNGPFDSVEVVTRSIYMDKISAEVLSKASEKDIKFHILAEDVDLSKPGGIVGTLLFQNRLKKALWRDVRSKLRPSPGDIVVFVTAEMFISPLILKIARHFKSRGAYVVPMVHNVFIFFPEVLEPSDMPAIRRFYFSGYEAVTEKFGKIGEKVVLFRKKILNDATRRIGELSDGFLLPSLHMKMIDTEKPVFRMMTRFPSPETLEKRRLSVSELLKRRPVRFTIPGRVSEKRKDFDQVIDALMETDLDDIEVVFLGRLESNIIRNRLDTLPHSVRSKIKTFDNFIEENTYLQFIQNSHYILMPLFFPYGAYKTTGAIGDAVSNGVPMVINEGRVSDDLIPHVTYREGELAEKLVELSRLENYNNLSEEIIEFASKHTLDMMAKKFNRFMGKIVR